MSSSTALPIVTALPYLPYTLLSTTNVVTTDLSHIINVLVGDKACAILPRQLLDDLVAGRDQERVVLGQLAALSAERADLRTRLERLEKWARDRIGDF